ncbi:hypothetical protein WSM22_09190 [Cytophagales bacterium WSM2-2]|nr:hypothetical protein WSM22_09190 [Cytophagales bacterium WSM2-2]
MPQALPGFYTLRDDRNKYRNYFMRHHKNKNHSKGNAREKAIGRDKKQGSCYFGEEAANNARH